MKISTVATILLALALAACSSQANFAQPAAPSPPPSAQITPELLSEIVALLKKNKAIKSAYAVRSKEGSDYMLVPVFDQEADMTSLYEIVELFNSRVSDSRLSLALLTPTDMKTYVGDLAPFYLRP